VHTSARPQQRKARQLIFSTSSDPDLIHSKHTGQCEVYVFTSSKFWLLRHLILTSLNTNIGMPTVRIEGLDVNGNRGVVAPTC